MFLSTQHGYAASTDYSAMPAPTPAAATSTPVTWAGPVNVDASAPSGTIAHNGIQGIGAGAWNAGAVSTRAITSTSAQAQGVEFQCGAAGETCSKSLGNCKRMMVGLGGVGGLNGATPYGGEYTDIEFGLQCCDAGGLQVIESGVHKAGPGAATLGNYAPDDVLKIQVTGNVVQYLKNDRVFYTSARSVEEHVLLANIASAAPLPLSVGAVFADKGGVLRDVAMYPPI